MIKRLILVLIPLLIFSHTYAQWENPDSLKNLLVNSGNDTERINLLEDLFYDYLWSFPDSSLIYLQSVDSLANRSGSDLFLSIADFNKGWYYSITGDYLQALYAYQEVLRLAEKSGN